MVSTWQAGPGAVDPSEPWLYNIDQVSGVVNALLDPFCDPPPGAEDAGIGEWRLARYPLLDCGEVREELDEQVPAEMPEELRAVLCSVLDEVPEEMQCLNCAQTLELVGESGRDWVAMRTEHSLRALLDLLRADERGDMLVSRLELEELAHRTAVISTLLDDWIQSGGRFAYLRGFVAAIDSRRASLLDAMDEQPTSLAEWADVLRHRLVEHLSDADADMSHKQADELAWTAAMALEAAFVLATRAGDESTVAEMLDDATNRLVEALGHGHDAIHGWMECATHSAIELPARTRSKRSREEALAILLGIYAHLAGAIVQAGRIECARDGHTHDDE